MIPGIPAQRLLKTAFYTSVILVGIFAVAPHLIVFGSPSSSAFVTGVLSVVVFLLILWFVNILLLYFSGKWGKQRTVTIKRYVLSYLICFLCIWLSSRFIDSFVHDPQRAPAHLYAIFVLGFILNSIVLVVQELIVIKDKNIKVELENAELKVRNVEAVNRQLQQQIHPHFLFNSLNTLKALIPNDPSNAGKYLVKLANLLRASLGATASNVTSLSAEIKLCLDYLEMQKLRFGQALQYTVTIPDEFQKSGWVPVFSILPLLENAIKHNRLTTDHPLFINITYEEGWLIVSNNLFPREAVEHSSGVGLENLSERYGILSGDKIIIDNDGKTFSVKIKVLRDESGDHRG